jgi:hypothetical protein
MGARQKNFLSNRQIAVKHGRIAVVVRSELGEIIAKIAREGSTKV